MDAVGAIIIVATTVTTVGLVTWQNVRKANRFEAAAQQLWLLSSQPCTFRVAEPADQALVDPLDASTTTELERTFTNAGDIVLELTGFPPGVALRIFVHAAENMIAYISAGSAVAFESYTDADEYVTRRGGLGKTVVAQPPFTHETYVPATTSLTDMLAQHRAARPNPAALLRVQTLEDVLEQFKRFHARTLEWRAAQEPDELLASDVRLLLGEEGFAKWGHGWIKRFKKKRVPPKAVVRPRPSATR